MQQQDESPKHFRFNNEKMTLVIDLDETLISSQLIDNTAPTTIELSDYIYPNLECFETSFTVDGQTQRLLVYKRPHLTQFLKKVSLWFDVILFTSSIKEYADVIIDQIEKDVVASTSGKIFSQRLYRQHCKQVIDRQSTFLLSTFHSQQKYYVKHLDTLGRDLDKIVIIDNSPIAYKWNERNAMPVSTWTHYSIDSGKCSELSQLLPFLHEIYMSNAIQKPLLEYNGQFKRNELIDESESHSGCIIS
jgi:Dullard-like phosphatase family protein